MAKAVYEALSYAVHFMEETRSWRVTDSKSGLWRHDTGGETVSNWFTQYLESDRTAASQMVMQRNQSAPKLITALQKLERYSAVQGAKDFLRSMPGVTVTQSKFDTDPYLVGLKDGLCIDLRNGNARKIVPSDYITMTLGTQFDATADCPLFKKSILEWCCGKVELARFLQVWSGYCLSGLTEFQGLLFLFGGGRNGKSVFTSTLTKLAGDYAQMMPSECLMAKDNSISNDVARLVGRRFVTAVELPENKVMDENKMALSPLVVETTFPRMTPEWWPQREKCFRQHLTVKEPIKSSN